MTEEQAFEYWDRLIFDQRVSENRFYFYRRLMDEFSLGREEAFRLWEKYLSKRPGINFIDNGGNWK